jgi:hypothetical protein
MRHKRHGGIYLIYELPRYTMSAALFLKQWVRFFQNSRGLLREHRITAHMDNRRPTGRMRPSISFNPALIHFSELTHIKLTSYDLRKTHHVFSHQGLFCNSSKFDYRFKTLYNKFKKGSVSNKWWSADHGLHATYNLASLVDTLALITRRISSTYMCE